MKTRILIVDDDSNILDGYKRHLRMHFDVDSAPSGEAALERLDRRNPYAVVVSDMSMPGMGGIQFLARVKEAAPETVRIMLTGYASQNTAIEAVNEGNIFRFLTKPCPPDVLVKTLNAGVEQFRLITAERELLEKTLSGSIKVLMEILSILDPDLFGRVLRLKELVQTLARALNVPSSWDIESAALLSRIGHVGIPPEVSAKSRKGEAMSHDEKEMLARVPEMGRHLLSNIPRLETVSRIVLYQDKRFDGSGFPSDSVAGDKIPLGARILKPLADLLEIESDGTSRGMAFKQLLSRKGWYDPDVVQKISQCLLDEKDQEIIKGRDFISIPFEELRPGHVLVSNVETSEGMLLLAAGRKLSLAHLERLRNYAKLSAIKEPIQVEDSVSDLGE